MKRLKNKKFVMSVEQLTKVISEALKALNSAPRQTEIRREYKLTKTGRIDLWIDKLKNELIARELPNILIGEEIDSEKDSQIIKDLILVRLDDNYHAQVLNVSDPCEIIQKIYSIKRSEMNLNSAAMRQKFSELTLKKGEKVADFIEKFEEVVSFFEFIENPLPADQIIDQGINATVKIYPSVRLRLLTEKNFRTLTYTDFRNILNEEEKANPAVVEEKPKAALAKTDDTEEEKPRNWNYPNWNRNRKENYNETRRRDVRCYKCKKMGHIAKDCHTKKLKCHKCGKLAFHRANECKGKLFKPYKKGKGKFDFKKKKIIKKVPDSTANEEPPKANWAMVVGDGEPPENSSEEHMESDVDDYIYDYVETLGGDLDNMKIDKI